MMKSVVQQFFIVIFWRFSGSYSFGGKQSEIDLMEKIIISIRVCTTHQKKESRIFLLANNQELTLFSNKL